jgi:AcrR family transcriptional regulator
MGRDDVVDRTSLEERRRGQILAAARQAFSDKGYDAATVDDIAQVAGVSKGLIYNYFQGKEDILIATAVAWLEPFEEHLEALAGAEEPATTKLLAVSRLALETMLKEWEYVQVQIELWSELHRRPQIARRYARMFRHMRSALVAIIEQGIARGEFRPVPAKEVASVMIATLDGLALQHMADQRAFSWRSVSAAMEDLVLNGLVAQRTCDGRERQR